jgi:hypothetical protein
MLERRDEDAIPSTRKRVVLCWERFRNRGFFAPPSTASASYRMRHETSGSPNQTVVTCFFPECDWHEKAFSAETLPGLSQADDLRVEGNHYPIKVVVMLIPESGGIEDQKVSSPKWSDYSRG